MPAGMPYFAWIDATETVFGPEHLRWDEQVFSFSMAQDEGDPASLTAVVRRPRNASGDPIGLLGPGRKIWCWFALDCGPDLVRFRGRLVGVPTSIFEELVTLEFVARPVDMVAQKAALADSLRVLPYYDEVVIDPSRRSDPDVVLEGYSAVWHYDRETHVITISDEITGEDGLVEFDGSSEPGKVLYDGLGLTLTSGPLARVDVHAEYTWTQLASGDVDLTQYILRNWPGAGPDYFTSFTLGADNWPKTGASLGTGWVASNGKAIAKYDPQNHSVTTGSTLTVRFPSSSWFGESSRTTAFTQTDSGPAPYPPGSLGYFTSMKDDIKVTHAVAGVSDAGEETYTSSYSRHFESHGTALLLNYVIPTLVAGYKAARPCTEIVEFSLFADVQPVLTDPDDGEALRIDDVKSVNLSAAIGDYIPIGDAGRRSYIATDRGNRSLEHLIALARAHLMKRARVVEISFAPKLERMPEITLRKNAFLAEPRVGEALGKIIGYTLALDGADGRIKCEVKIGCAIGRGGSAVASGGDPTYCTVDYTGPDYQQFTGRIVLFDSSVGYEPPNANPNDDGINFLAAVKPEDVIDIPVSVENTAQEQTLRVQSLAYWQVDDTLKQYETKVTFKLKSMSRTFSTPYELQVTDLSIPTGYDLEAA